MPELYVSMGPTTFGALFNLSSELYARHLLAVGLGPWQDEVRSAIEDMIKTSVAPPGFSYEVQAADMTSALNAVKAVFERVR